MRVLVCDDHQLVRSALRRLLESEPGIRVVAEAGDAEQAVRAARLEKPDLVLLDLVLPGPAGLEALPQILRAAPKAKVLVLSMLDDPDYIRAAFSLGAHGYLEKSAADAELLQAVRELAADRRYLHARLGARLASPAQAPSTASPLSARQREILRLLALGYTNEQIAQLLYLSNRTVETHRARLLRRLGLATRADLVRYAIEQRLLDEPPAAGEHRH